MNTLSILDSISATKKRTAKLSLLEEQHDNTLLQDVCHHALNPFLQYYIKKIPKYNSALNPDLSLEEFLSSLSEFTEREVTGNAAINRMSELLSRLHSDDAIVAERIIKGDLRCGASTKTFNKVWHDLIPTNPVLLASESSDENNANIIFPAAAQMKADGVRANVFVFHNKNGSRVEVKGRSGKLIDLLGVFDNAFIEMDLSFGNVDVGHMYDGELVVLDKQGKIMPRKKGNGIINKAIRGKLSAEEASRVRIRLWDRITIDEFDVRHCNIPYEMRFNKLETIVDLCPRNSVISLIEYRIVNNMTEVGEYFAEMLSRGEEGILVKNLCHLWEDVRSKHLIKFKSEKECDLEIIGWNEGRVGTKLEGQLGSLICQTVDGLLEVAISGFTDQVRLEFWVNRHQNIGRIITVKYNEVIDSETSNLKSLFLPRYQEIRNDKNDANTLPQLAD